LFGKDRGIGELGERLFRSLIGCTFHYYNTVSKQKRETEMKE